MLRNRLFYRATLLLALTAVVVGISLPHMVQRAIAQRDIGATELAYDDGIPYKTVAESEVACAACIEYQGVRFGLGGVEIATITSVRFYAYASATKAVRVHVNDVNQTPLLPDPIVLSVSRNGWYVVPLPELTVTGDFFVWIQTQSKSVMPFHDRRKDTGRSFRADEPDILIYNVEYGDLLIRASVRAEIHVGKDRLPNGAFKYKYQVIQEAVNDADPLLTIVVHPGTYIENVVVDKDISIVSSDGASVTTVQAASPATDVFSITSEGVSIDGFDVRGSGAYETAGVRLGNVSNCLVSNNRISDNYYGLYIPEPLESGSSRQNTVLQNVFSSNTHGIWLGGQQNNICGNRMEGNTAAEGPDIYLSEVSADNWVRFNAFDSTSSSNRRTQIYYDGTFKPVDAINNWWGDPSGPYHASENPNGSGAGVGEMIDFSPWLGGAPRAVKTGQPDVTDYVLDARTEASTSVILGGSGDPIVWVASYEGNPAGQPDDSSFFDFFDVCLSDTGSVDDVEIEFNYSPDKLGTIGESDVRLYWWNGSEWAVCSKQKTLTNADTVRATITPTSRPNLSNLAGTPFAMGAPLGSQGFQWLWVLLALAGLIGLFVVVIFGRLLLRFATNRGTYDQYDDE